ncbi:MAG: FAD binding domain-containing protein, partial [Candidatus Bathyarchaeia archaeon]
LNCGCVAVSPSDLAVALIALGAKVKIVGPSGERVVPVEDLYVTPRPLIEQDELLTEVFVPAVPETAMQAFSKFRLRSSVDFAMVSLALMVSVKDGVCEDARIVLGAVSPRPIRAASAEKAIRGKRINTEVIEAVAEAIVEGASPLSMNAYKLQILKKLIKDSLWDMAIGCGK